MKTAIRFLPLVVIYILVLSLTSTHIGRSDQARYIWYAENLSKGYFTPRSDVNLWSGPGYPLVLAPFAALGLPWTAARVLNIVLLFCAVIYLRAALRRYTGDRPATIAAYVLGLWPPLVIFVPRLMTEVLAVFLVCGFTFHYFRLNSDGGRPRLHLILASVYLAYLALTRVLFGYVIVAALVIMVILLVWRRSRAVKAGLGVFLLALAFCVPYLSYTYSLTHRVFYWASSGGLSLYWMASPYEGDLGEWHLPTEVRGNPDLSENHLEFFNEISVLSTLERDSALRQRALEHIASNPSKFMRNWVANIGRLLFNYPYTTKSQKMDTYSKMIPGMFIAVFSILAIYPALAGRRRIPAEIWILLLFGLISLGASSLLSAYNRLFLPVVPIVVVWLAVVLVRTLKVEVLRHWV